MRARFEFSLYPVAAQDVSDGIDPTLALMGAQGWEIRGIAHTPDGGLTFALQRPLDEELPLPDAPTLAATLEEPLTAPAREDLTPSASREASRAGQVETLPSDRDDS